MMIFRWVAMMIFFISELKLKYGHRDKVDIYHWESDTLYISGKQTQICDKLSYYRFEDKLYEKEAGRLFQINGQQIEEIQILSPTHQAYLNFLIDKNGAVASFDELSQLEGKHVNNNTVSKHIGSLKRLLGCEIDNVPRQGYKLHAQPQLVDVQSYQQKVIRKTSPATMMASLIGVLVIIVGWLSLNSISFGIVENTVAPQKITMMQGAESHGTFSPDGRFVAFEYRSSAEQLTHLWIKDVKTGERTQLTASVSGVEDEISAFSADGDRLLFHRTYQDNVCTVNELVFNSKEPLQFSEQTLFRCHDGYKSINAEYGKDLDTIYYTDYPKEQTTHQVYRFDRKSAETSRVFSLDNSGQGIYRVYPMAKGRQLLLLSSDDWTSSRFFLLHLDENRLQHLLDSPQVVKSVGVDRDARVLYFMGAENKLNRFDIASNQLSQFGLKGQFDGFVSYSPQLNQVLIDGKAAQSKKIVRIKNPLKHSGINVVDEISSSGSDNLPKVCGQWVFFFSDRTGQYRLWQKHLLQNRAQQVLKKDFKQLPEAIDVNRDCTRIALVDHNAQLNVIDLAANNPPVQWSDHVFINVAWRNNEQLVVSIQKDGYRLAKVDLKDNRLSLIDTLPQSKTFALDADGQQLFLFRHFSSELMTYQFADHTKHSGEIELPLLRNSAWQIWQNKGIYHYLDNAVDPVWRYLRINDGNIVNVALPMSFKNAHFSMSPTDDDTLWIVQNKAPKQDIYIYQLTDK